MQKPKNDYPMDKKEYRKLINAMQAKWKQFPPIASQGELEEDNLLKFMQECRERCAFMKDEEKCGYCKLRFKCYTEIKLEKKQRTRTRKTRKDFELKVL